MLNWLKRKQKPTKPSPKLQKILDETQPLDQKEVKMLDEEGKTHPFDMNWAMKLRSRRHKAMDIEFFRQIKRALALKKQRKFYRSEQQIAKKFNISQTTVALIRRSRSLKQYRELRQRMSKGQK
mgnify:CR=1 FL=1